MTPSVRDAPSERAPSGRRAATAGSLSPTGAEAVRDSGDANEQLLRQAAHELFSKRGLGVPLSDIAKAAGVGVATLYRRYRDKDILILDVYREFMKEGEEFAAEANAVEDPWEGIEFFLRRSMEQLELDLGMRDLIIGGYMGGAGWARGSTHDEVLKALDVVDGRVSAQLKMLVARARAAGVVRSDFHHDDLLLMTTMVHSAVPIGSSGRPEMIRRALTLLLEGIRPQAED